MSNFFRRVTGAGHERRESRPDDLLRPQFTREGWDQYVAACTRALDRAFPSETWRSYVDRLKSDDNFYRPGFGQRIVSEDYKDQLAIAMFCFLAEGILLKVGADEELKQRAGFVGEYLREELEQRFPTQYADGRVPMVSFPKHPGDFREG